MSKKITDLTAASSIQDDDSFVLEQEGQAMRLPGFVLREYVTAELVKTTSLSINWAEGTYTEVLSDGSTLTKDISFDENGMPVAFGDMAFSMTGV